MHFFKVACFATTLLCLVYTGDCELLTDSLTTVVNEITPLITEIDNDIAVALNILRGLKVTDLNSLTATVQATLWAVAQPILDAINALKGVLGPAANCVIGAAEKMVVVIVNAANGYINCVESAASQVPGFLGQIEDLVTRRNDPSIANLTSESESLVQLGSTFGAVSSLIDSAVSLLTGVLADVTNVVSKISQAVLSMLACIVKVKLEETEAGFQILKGIVSCAANLGVSVSLPALPPSPADTACIIEQAVATYEDEIACLTYAVAAWIANTTSTVKSLADQAAAITADVIDNAISDAVQPYIAKLTRLQTLNLLNPALQADLKGCIDKLKAILNSGVAVASRVISQLSQKIASLEQEVADLANELVQLVQNYGVSAIIECGNDVIYNTPEFVTACTDAVLSNSQHILYKIKADLTVANVAGVLLNGQIIRALAGQAALVASQAADSYKACTAMLSSKHGNVV